MAMIISAQRSQIQECRRNARLHWRCVQDTSTLHGVPLGHSSKKTTARIHITRLHNVGKIPVNVLWSLARTVCNSRLRDRLRLETVRHLGSILSPLLTACVLIMLADGRPDALLARASFAIVFADARPATLLAHASDAVVLADARPAALLARSSSAVVLADARPAALLARASSAVVWALCECALSRNCSCNYYLQTRPRCLSL